MAEEPAVAEGPEAQTQSNGTNEEGHASETTNFDQENTTVDEQDEVEEAELDDQSLVLNAEIEKLRSTVAVQQSELAGLRQEVADAAGRYRDALLAGSPELPEELIQGQTVEELDQSLASAKRIVEKVASRLEAQATVDRVPSGAPARRSADLTALSAREKILYALQKG